VGTPAADRLDLVDAHHHLLNLEAVDYPWIRRRSPPLEALLDNYYDIAHDYDVDDYLTEVEDERLVKSVACEFGSADPVEEAAWVQRQADAHGFPHAFIAGIDLASPAVGEVLERYRELPVVRAVRQPMYWAEDPLRRLGARADFLTDPDWWRGFERVADQGLVWELLLYDAQLPAAHQLIESFPDTDMVLEAAGWPLDLTPDGFKRWRERLQAVSEFPNVTLKFQGLPLLFGPSIDELGPWVRTAVGIFGARRCMFASDFPIDRLLCGFQELVSTLLAVLSDLNAEEQSAFFSGCARRQYGLA
jgi:predicted TIM-barrel fold metal-dependent hydrolase